MNALTQKKKAIEKRRKEILMDLIKAAVAKEAQPKIDEAIKESTALTRKTTIAEVICLLRERGWHKDKIKEFYEDMIQMEHRESLYNKTVTNYDVLQHVAEKYEIDFDRLDTDFSVERSENNESGTAH